jgi:hypothetical protein
MGEVRAGQGPAAKRRAVARRAARRRLAIDTISSNGL